MLGSTIVPFPLESSFEKGAAAASSANLDRVVAAFEYNLTEAIDLAALPFTVGCEITNRALFQRLHIAARIRARPPFGTAEDIVDEEAAARNANIEFKEITSKHSRPENSQGYDHLFSIIETVNGLLSSADFRERSQSLLRQSAILTWNALEVFVRDLLEVAMNESSSLALRFIKDPEASNRFEIKRVSLAGLEDFQFDLSQRLGTYILEGRDLSDISALRVCLFALCPGQTELQTALKSHELYLLCKKRHLFVHRRGIVDKKYIAESGCPEKAGDKLLVVPSDLERDISLVWGVGKKVFQSVVELGKQL